MNGNSFLLKIYMACSNVIDGSSFFIKSSSHKRSSRGIAGWHSNGLPVGESKNIINIELIYHSSLFLPILKVDLLKQRTFSDTLTACAIAIITEVVTLKMDSRTFGNRNFFYTRTKPEDQERTNILFPGFTIYPI